MQLLINDDFFNQNAVHMGWTEETQKIAIEFAKLDGENYYELPDCDEHEEEGDERTLEYPNKSIYLLRAERSIEQREYEKWVRGIV